VNEVDGVGGASSRGSFASIIGILNCDICNSNGEVSVNIKSSIMTDLVQHFRELTTQNSSLLAMQKATSEKLVDVLKRLEKIAK
jgi:hypothetical protein